MSIGIRFLLGVCAMSLPVTAGAQPPAPGSGAGPTRPLPIAADLDRVALDVLRDVHNRGAELYNRGDAAGCYRMYEAALLVVRPFLAHRPAIQGVIDAGLAEVAKTDGAKIQAFRLHEVIEDVRGRLKVELKITEPARPNPMPKEKASAPGATALAGTITLDGKPAAGVEVTIVTLDQPLPRVFTARADEKGAFKFGAGPRVGRFVAAVSSPGTLAIPEKYQTTGTSGLIIDVTDPAQPLRLALSTK